MAFLLPFAPLGKLQSVILINWIYLLHFSSRRSFIDQHFHDYRSAEDLAGQSFAGQYDTFLYKTTIDEVSESIKACWASMFKDHLGDYATKSVFLDAKEGKDVNEPRVYTPGSMTQPRMGALVMKMIEAKASGVCFTQNLWGEKNECMIEAVFGQGEGLVGGEITPDRFVLNKHSTSLCYEQLSTRSNAQVCAIIKHGWSRKGGATCAYGYSRSQYQRVEGNYSTGTSCRGVLRQSPRH